MKRHHGVLMARWPRAPGADRSRASLVGLLVLAMITFVSVVLAPMATPLLACAGGVASLVAGAQARQSRIRWLPLALFVLAIGYATVIDVQTLSFAPALT
jgi:hypothetical protein